MLPADVGKITDAVVLFISRWFDSSCNVRCTSKAGESGHNFNQSVTLMTKSKGIVNLARCCYCGRVERNEEEDLMLLGIGPPPSFGDQVN